MEDFTQSGLIAIADGDYDTAIDLLNKAINKDEKSYKANLLRGIAYSNKGDYPKAIVDFNNAEKLRNENENDEFYYFRGKTYFYNQQIFEAKKDLEKAKNINGISEEGKNKINKLLELTKLNE
jgi:tetratricopeptide (TPR) repeat protein